MSSTYGLFIQRVKDYKTAKAVEALLEWDQETCMPRRAAEARAEQAALVAGVAHEKLTSDELGSLLTALERESDGDVAAATNIREMRREVDRAVRIPTALVKELARSIALAKDAWLKARQDADFQQFAPHLDKLLEIKREIADRIGWTTERFDALMDEFEPGAKAAEIHRLFDHLQGELVALVAAIGKATRRPNTMILERPCPRESQERINRRIAEAMTFDFDAGRIDVSAHPFCTSMTSRDVRMTTRYNENYAAMSLFGIMHEAGHGLYEQGLDFAHAGTPMAEAVSLGIHESQSRMWENMIGRSRPFWQHFFPLLQSEFPSMADVKLDDWCFAINAVRPSFIRVEADEVTYGLHIMLRFDLERRMIAGKLATKDVPAAWNEGMKSLLGITPPDDAQGCLQDVHWSQAAFGYFPTYQLGNLYAAQFLQAARRDMPELDARVCRGELRPLREWLREKIHRHGKRYRAAELVEVVAGSELSHRPYLEYLNAKFRPLYGI